jgi:hypothetical protein
MNLTYDGKTYFEIVFNPLIGLIFFYDNQMIEHTREARHWIDVISDWGGLHAIIFAIAS